MTLGKRRAGAWIAALAGVTVGVGVRAHVNVVVGAATHEAQRELASSRMADGEPLGTFRKVRLSQG